MLDPEKLREIEDLKRELRILEAEEKQTEEQLALIRKQKVSIINSLNEMSDEDYERDMLAKVYEQRRKK
ncbi:MAG: hypothetical protein K6B67_04590 [Lachnospiraceae bacterium]|nr:hypothetical protein [Lachnospiraceae bacterium]